jgi:hypothetical protein
MAPQNFNPWSLTFDISHVANTTTIYDCTVSDCGSKLCVAISGRAIFSISFLFVLHEDYET